MSRIVLLAVLVTASALVAGIYLAHRLSRRDPELPSSPDRR